MSTNRNECSNRQRRAAQLEASGNMSAAQIAHDVGVTKETVSRWRRDQAYLALREEFVAATTERALADAALTRTAALRTMRRAVTLLEESLEPTVDDEGRTLKPTAADADRVIRALTPLYRITGAQTGISETTRQEVAVSGPEEARRKLHEELAGLDPDTLRRLRDGRPEGG